MVKLANTVFSDEIRENEDLNTMDVHLEEIGTDSATIVNRLGYLTVKRILDIIVSFCALLILLVPIMVIALLIKIESPGPAIFRQKRMGKGGKPFVMYKFRTMRMDAPHEMATRDFADADKYITNVGAVLRRTSLDELPEAFNILKGDMSIIGPRPLAMEYLPYYTEEERVRHQVRPGLSGLAQAKGRNSLSWEEKFAYDIEYVNNITFMHDLKILFWTVKKFIARSDIGQGEKSPESLHIIRQREKENSEVR